MTMTIAELPTSVPLGPALTEGQAREIFRQGEEAVVFALLSLAKQLAEQQPSAAPLGHGPQLPQAGGGRAPQTARTEGRTSGRAAPHARADRSAGRSSPRTVSDVPGAVDPHQPDPHPDHRGHPRADHPG